MASGITLKLDGFEELIAKIKAANGDVSKAVDKAMKKSADVQQEELKSQMHKAKFKTHTGVDSGLVNRMPPPSVEWDGNRCVAKIGYPKGEYNKKNPSDAYEVIFLNYGTPRIKPTRFINKAKSKAKPQIKKAQEEAFNEIIQELRG